VKELLSRGHFPIRKWCQPINDRRYIGNFPGYIRNFQLKSFVNF